MIFDILYISNVLQNQRGGVNWLEKKSIMLRIPDVLLKRIDEFQEKKGFGTRTQAIFYLINHALEDLLNKKTK